MKSQKFSTMHESFKLYEPYVYYTYCTYIWVLTGLMLCSYSNTQTQVDGHT